MPATEPPPSEAGGESTAQAAEERMAREVGDLARLHLTLARHELQRALRLTRGALASLVIAGALAVCALLAAHASAFLGLSEVLPLWAAAAIVAAVDLVLAGVLVVVARRRRRRGLGAATLPETRRILGESLAWIASRNGSSRTSASNGEG